MSEWRLIETAPPDELVLTIWDGVNNKTGKPARHWNVAMLVDGQWCEPEFGDHIDEPTHWQPLPAPPSTDGESVAKEDQ